MSTESTSRKIWIDEKGRWEFINDWTVPPQSNDRMQASGEVRNIDGRPVKRSIARRQHQLNYKRWSQERSD